MEYLAIRKISCFMKLRIIAVPVGNEIKSFQMTLGIFFFSPRVFCRLSSIMTVLKGKYSFQGVISVFNVTN